MSEVKNEEHTRSAEEKRNADYQDFKVLVNRFLKPCIVKRSLIRGNKNGNGSFSGKNCQE